MQKVLIVDEKPASLKMISTVVERKYQVFTATNSVEAKQCLDAEKPNIMLVDANMKTTDSIQLVEKIRKNQTDYKNIPVIFLMKNPVSELVRRASAVGAVDIEIKPLEPLAFYAKIEKTMQLSMPVKERLDEGTGLHKKQFTEEMIQLKVALREPGTMVMVDVDSMSFVSTSLKPEILQPVADTIKEEFALADGMVGVMGAGSFIGFIPDIVDRTKMKQWSMALIERIQGCCQKKLYVSIGLADINEKALQYADLYQSCDRALNLARQDGKNHACYYN